MPILEFDFKSIDHLANMIKCISQAEDTTKGLILTSPRVISAIHKAASLLDPDRPTRALESFDSDAIFVVGVKTGRDCENKLGRKYNIESQETGNSQSLAKFISSSIDKHTTGHKTVLLYPKGSRADNSIEQTFGENSKIDLRPIVVYDTKPIDDIAKNILDALTPISKILDKTEELVLNLVFFSPSGIEGFDVVSETKFCDEIKTKFKIAGHVKLTFSAIGRTTEAALKQSNHDVLCVAEKPNPVSLVEAILKHLSRISNSPNKI